MRFVVFEALSLTLPTKMSTGHTWTGKYPCQFVGNVGNCGNSTSKDNNLCPTFYRNKICENMFHLNLLPQIGKHPKTLKNTHNIWLHSQLQSPWDMYSSKFRWSHPKEKKTCDRWNQICPVLCHTHPRRRERTVVTYVAKATSLVKTLIKPLTINPTMPDLKANQWVCTKESGGIQVVSQLSLIPPFTILKDCTWKLNDQCLYLMINWRKNMNSVVGGSTNHPLWENLLSSAPAAIFFRQLVTIFLITNTVEWCHPALGQSCQFFKTQFCS